MTPPEKGRPKNPWEFGTRCAGGCNLDLTRLPLESVRVDPNGEHWCLDCYGKRFPKDSTKVESSTSVLREALAVVYGDRQQSYGTPAENHERTAELWTAYIRSHGAPSWKFSARDVCMFNILQKISRDHHAPKRDNLVDIAGYAENAHLCAEPPTGKAKAAMADWPASRLPLK